MIALRLLITRKDRREWLEAVLSADPELKVVRSGADADDIAGYQHLGADVIVIDLDHPQADQPRFWSVLHVYFTGARFMVMAEAPINPSRLQAALHAGGYYMVEWTEPLRRLQRAAHAAGHGEGFIPLGNVLMAMTAFFDASGASILNIRIGDLELDLRQGAILRGTDVILLTKLEQDFLMCLIGSAGRPVSNSELLRAVWRQSRGSNHLNEQIKSTVKRLRQKLETELGRPRYILNRHGHGYYVPETEDP